MGLAKHNIQVLPRTIATLRPDQGYVKDVQAILGQTKADTTVNVDVQPIEASVRETQEAIYAELTGPAKLVAVS